MKHTVSFRRDSLATYKRPCYRRHTPTIKAKIMTDEIGKPADSAAQNPAELALIIYNLLAPQESELRRRVMQSAMTLLGETAVNAPAASADAQSSGGLDDLNLGPKALKWIQRNAVSREMLDELFHLTGDGIDIIASTIPGASKREMTVNCYLLSGIRGLLKEDAPSLNESETIAVCKRLTAYDRNNHTSNRQAVGNRMSGNRPTFTLTGPGETAAADLIKQMTGAHGS